MSKVYVVIVDDEQEFEHCSKLKMEVFFNEDDWIDRMAAYDSIDTPCSIKDFDSINDYTKWVNEKLNEIIDQENEDDFDD